MTVTSACRCVSDGALSLEGCKSFNLDEYVGAGANDAHSYLALRNDRRARAYTLQSAYRLKQYTI